MPRRLCPARISPLDLGAAGGVDLPLHSEDRYLRYFRHCTFCDYQSLIGMDRVATVPTPRTIGWPRSTEFPTTFHDAHNAAEESIFPSERSPKDLL